MTTTPADQVASYWSRQAGELTAGIAALGAGDLAAVHPTRVAVRRLRSTVRTFSRAFPQDLVAGLDDELRWVAVQLGAVRDRQVLRELFAAHENADPDTVARLDERLATELEELADGLPRLLADPRLTDAVERVEALRSTPLEVRKAHGRLARTRRTVARRLKRAGSDPAPARMHSVRKAVKRARYAAEVFAGEAGSDRETPLTVASADVAAAFVQVLRFERLQEVLGRFWDLVTAGEYVESAMGDAGVDGALLAALRQDLADEADAVRAELFALAAAPGSDSRSSRG